MQISVTRHFKIGIVSMGGFWDISYISDISYGFKENFPAGAVEHKANCSGFSKRYKKAVVVIGERPYAEMYGDSRTLSIPQEDKDCLARVRNRADQVVVILISGRPLLIEPEMAKADAFVAAWLPGTEGAGIIDVLSGDKPFTGRLSFTWPKNIAQIPWKDYNGKEEPLFHKGFGEKIAM